MIYDEDDIIQSTVSISELNDGDFFRIQYEDENDEYLELDLNVECAIWLAKEILQRTGENIDP